MSKLKRVARFAAGALLVTGIFASAAAPADAVDDSGTGARMVLLDTGWGG
jgi:hypothetical protein